MTWNFASSFILQRIRFLPIFNTFGRSIMVIFGQAFFEFCKIRVPWSRLYYIYLHTRDYRLAMKIIDWTFGKSFRLNLYSASFHTGFTIRSPFPISKQVAKDGSIVSWVCMYFLESKCRLKGREFCLLTVAVHATCSRASLAVLATKLLRLESRGKAIHIWLF